MLGLIYARQAHCYLSLSHILSPNNQIFILTFLNLQTITAHSLIFLFLLYIFSLFFFPSDLVIWYFCWVLSLYSSPTPFFPSLFFSYPTTQVPSAPSHSGDVLHCHGLASPLPGSSALRVSWEYYHSDSLHCLLLILMTSVIHKRSFPFPDETLRCKL